jgi:putative transposase
VYFITICTVERGNFFGNIVCNPESMKNEIQLSDISHILKSEWLKTPGIRPDMNLTLDSWVVMPDHFHGIIVIGENAYNRENDKIVDGDDDAVGDGCRDAMHGVSTIVPMDPIYYENPDKTINPADRFGPQRKNLASVIRGFKSAVTMQARRIHPGFAWQEGFYDHIIRDNDSLNRVRHYILSNVENWKTDSYH